MAEQSIDTYRKQVEVTGRVLEVSIPKGQCQLWMNDSTCVPLAFTEKQEPCISNALKSHKYRELTVSGIGEFTPDGVLKRIVRADEFRLSYNKTELCYPNAPSLMDRIMRRFDDIPEEELEKLPSDLSIRHDYYLYGIDRE